MNLALLKNKNFFLILIGGFVSSIGSKVLSICLSLYVLGETGSAAMFASILAVSIIPTLIISPIAGVLADNFNKKYMMVIFDFLSGTLILFYCILFSVKGSLTINNIYILVIIESSITAFYNPLPTSILPYCVKKDELIDANGLNSLFFTISGIIAPIIGTSLFGLLGLFIILIVDCISFYLSAISEIFINIQYERKNTKLNVKSFAVEIKEGFKVIKNIKILSVILLLGLIANCVCSPIMSIGLNYITKINLNLSDYKIGILNSIITISTMLAPFLCKVVYKKFSLGYIIFLDILFQSIFFLMLSIVSNDSYINLFSKTVAFVSVIVVGFFINLICCTGNIALTTIIQKKTPLSYLGRVQATLSSLLIITTPLGQIVFGFLFDNISSSMCILISSVILLISIMLLKKSLLSYSNDTEDKYMIEENIN